MSRCIWRRAAIVAAVGACTLAVGAAGALASEPPDCWNVHELREGMTGYGVTCLQGTKLERFEVTVLGVLKGQSPGRDAVLARLSGLGLEKTGVIGGMSGSPVYIDGKLVGAVAFTWAYNKDPICGITPFSQMLEYARPGRSHGRAAIAAVAVSEDYRIDGALLVADRFGRMVRIDPESAATAEDGEAVSAGGLVPIATPISASGISSESLRWLAAGLKARGAVPVFGGHAAANLPERPRTKLAAGGPLAVGLVTGDVSITGVGTVTAIFGNRVYGFGHPFMSLGDCELPLLDAYIHAVIPKQTISTKIGSALEIIGRISADVSTCIAGELGEGPDLLPATIRVRRPASSLNREFKCQLSRDPTMLGMLAVTAISSCVDMEGQPPCELTTRLRTRIAIEGYPPLVCEDLYSGSAYSGAGGLVRCFIPVGNLLTILAANPYHRPRILSIDCETEIVDERRAARIIAARPRKYTLVPGEPLVVDVTLEPFRSRCGCVADPVGSPTAPERREISLEVALPANVPPGKYQALVGDAPSDLRCEFQNRRHLNNAEDFQAVYELLRLQLASRRTHLSARVNLPNPGLAVRGVELPELPAAFADVLSAGPARTSTVVESTVARIDTRWFIEGSATASFEVVERREFHEPDRRAGPPER